MFNQKIPSGFIHLGVIVADDYKNNDGLIPYRETVIQCL